MSADDWKAWMTRIEGKLDKLIAARGASPSSGPQIAVDADLDGQWGDPEVRKDPKRWDGESMVGRRFSETSPAFLRVLADFLLWQAGKDEQKIDDEQARKRAPWKRRDAARALGWAARLENGWKRPDAQPAAEEEGW